MTRHRTWTARHAACRACKGGEPGHGKPRAGLRRRGLDRRASGERRQGGVPPGLTLPRRTATADFYGQALRASVGTQATPGIEPAASWPRSGVNRCAIEHNRALPKVGQSLRCASLGGRPLARPAGSGNGRLCLAPLRVGRGAGEARAAQQPVGVIAHAPSRVFSQALRAKVEWSPARPGPSAARACGPAGLRSRARSRPSRPPRKRGSPKFNGNPGLWGESSRRLPREPSAVLAASRVRFAAARP